MKDKYIIRCECCDGDMYVLKTFAGKKEHYLCTRCSAMIRDIEDEGMLDNMTRFECVSKFILKEGKKDEFEYNKYLKQKLYACIKRNTQWESNADIWEFINEGNFSNDEINTKLCYIIDTWVEFKHWLEDKYEWKIKVKGREDD